MITTTLEALSDAILALGLPPGSFVLQQSGTVVTIQYANTVTAQQQIDANALVAAYDPRPRVARSLLTLDNAITALSAGQKTNIGNDLYDTTSTPSSTNTATDVLTFAADPTWPTGSSLTVATTGGGLTAGTSYFYRRLTATTGSIYTTLANAQADTNRVNLTASITSAITRPGRWSSNIGPNRSGMYVVYLLTKLGLSAVQTTAAKVSGAAMMAQDNPMYLVNPAFDPTINIDGSEVVP